jgi:tetratricopeptide (TPR) repeat protein
VLYEEARARIESTGLKLGRTPRVWASRPKGEEELTQRLGRARYLLSRVQEGEARVVARQGLKTYPDDLGLLTIHLVVMHRATQREPVIETVEKLRELYPNHQEALHWLAHYEYAAKHPDRAEALTLAAAEVGPKDADLLYDLACARSVAKDASSALAYLRQAVEAGYRDWDWIDKDPDLAAVRSDPGYGTLRHAAGR